MTTSKTDENAADSRRSSSTDLFCFRWWFKGETPDGNTMKLEGEINAASAYDAADKVDAQMRKRFPKVRWMRGRKIEGDGIQYGPTVRRLKKPNAEATDGTTDEH